MNITPVFMCADRYVSGFFYSVIFLKILPDAAAILIFWLRFKAANHFAADIQWQGVLLEINKAAGFDFLNGLQGFTLGGIVGHAVSSELW